MEKPKQEEGTVEPIGNFIEIKEKPKIQKKSSDLSSDDSEIEPIISEHGSMKKKIFERSEFFLDLIMKSDLKSIEGNYVVHINQKLLDVKVSTLCINCSNQQKCFKRTRIQFQMPSRYHLI